VPVNEDEGIVVGRRKFSEGGFMRSRSKRYLAFGSIIFFLFGLWLYDSQYISTAGLSPQELAVKQLFVSALSSRGVWDQEFLAQDSALKEKLVQFEEGELCKSLKELDNKNLTYHQMIHHLKGVGYTCIVRPLAVNPNARPLSYLKIDNTITQNPKEEGVAHQEICWDPLQPVCVIRIKKDGFPLNRRPAPHSSKAVLIDGKGDPGSYAREAFKVSSQGRALPKGPSGKFGLRKCPYYKDRKFCDRWVDAVMDEAHPILKLIR